MPAARPGGFACTASSGTPSARTERTRATRSPSSRSATWSFRSCRERRRDGVDHPIGRMCRSPPAREGEPAMGLRIPESVERALHRAVTFLLALALGPPATSIGYAALGDLRGTYTIDPIAD